MGVAQVMFVASVGPPLMVAQTTTSSSVPAVIVPHDVAGAAFAPSVGDPVLVLIVNGVLYVLGGAG